MFCYDLNCQELSKTAQNIPKRPDMTDDCEKLSERSKTACDNLKQPKTALNSAKQPKMGMI
jgi:hypothetical protein